MRSRGTAKVTPSVRKPRIKGPRKRLVLSRTRVLAGFIFVIVCIYGITLVSWSHGGGQQNSVKQPSQDRLLRKSVGQRRVPAGKTKSQQRKVLDNDISQSSLTYDFWKGLAVKLASLTATEALESLEQLDPFGTRRFEESLLQEETRLGRQLTQDEITKLFPCPNDRISLPDQRDAKNAQHFRSGDPGTFLFFQHLRKAGGTHFCSIAQSNMAKSEVPKYYCMPDMAWSGGKLAGYLHHYSNEEIIRRMAEKGHRVAGNEFDNFDPSKHFDLPAVFATSFRRPLDRALSQFRFECIEDRGCSIKDVGKWWKQRADLYNVYVCTFSDGPCLKRIYFGDSYDYAKQREQLMGKAIDTVAKFNLVLSMEWLSYAAPQVQDVLGFTETSVLSKRVRPHISQARRGDQQDQNNGASGIAKASWIPKDYLTPEQYEMMSESLALDEILTDAARRIFLERMVCNA